MTNPLNTDAVKSEERAAFEAACQKLADMPEKAHEKLFGNDDLDTWWALWKEARASSPITSPKAVNSGQTEREALTEAEIIAAIQKATGKFRTNDSYSFEDVWECVEAAVNSRVEQRCQCCGYLVTESEHRGCLRAAAPQGLTDEQIRSLKYVIGRLEIASIEPECEHARNLRALLADQSPAPASPSGEDAAEQSAAPIADDVEDDDIQPTPESERAAFNAMMRWHLIRLLQAWRYGGDLRAAGMAAFKWARSNDVGKAAFEASERAVKLSAALPRASEQADEAADAARYRFARDNIQEGHELPGGFYLNDTGDTWDKTIDAARAKDKS